MLAAVYARILTAADTRRPRSLRNPSNNSNRDRMSAMSITPPG